MGSKGVVLIIISTMLVLMLGLAITLLRFAAIGSAIADVHLQNVAARMNAASGMDYAAARLYRSADRFPGFPHYGDPGWPGDIQAGAHKSSPASRGDDWHYRGYDLDPGNLVVDPVSGAVNPVPLDALDPVLHHAPNPSYAHGESWNDTLVADGAYGGQAEFDPACDIDRDGRLTAFSGRLRSDRFGASVFRLRVEPAACKIPLNAPPLKNHGVPLPDPNIENVDLLGAALGISYVLEPSGPGGPRVVLSDIGERIAAGGPPFRSWEELKARSGLTEAEFRSIRRFVSLTPFPPGRPDLNHAPPRLLESLLRYRFSKAGDFVTKGLQGIDPAVDPNTGLPYSAYPWIAMIHPAEASAVARTLHAQAYLRGGFQSWNELFRLLDREKGGVFPNGIATGPFLHQSEGYQNVKTDLVFRALHLRPGEDVRGIEGFASYDADRFIGGSLPPEYSGRIERETMLVRNSGVCGLPLPLPGGYTGDAPWDGTDDGNGADRFLLGVRSDWTLAEPAVFDIASQGNAGPRTAFTEWRVCLGEYMVVDQADDFVNALAFQAPWGLGPGGYRKKWSWGGSGNTLWTDQSATFSTDNQSGIGNLNVVPNTHIFPPFLYKPATGAPLNSYPGSAAITLAPRPFWTMIANDGLMSLDYYNPWNPDDNAIGNRMVMHRIPNDLYPSRWVPPMGDQENNGEFLPDVYRAIMKDHASAFGLGLFRYNYAWAGDDMWNSTGDDDFRYAFNQVPGTQPDHTAPLVSGADPVPDVIAGIPEVKYVKSLMFHFTYTGPRTDKIAGSSGLPVTDKPPAEQAENDYQQVFLLAWRTHPQGFKGGILLADYPEPPGGHTYWSLVRMADGRWSMRFHKGFAASTGGTIPDYYHVADGRHPVKGWDDGPSVHRCTMFYISRDGDSQYPPEEAHWGLYVDGASVIAESWTPVPGSPYPPAGMFFRALGTDPRRVLRLQFQDATNVVISQPSTNDPTLIQAAHNAYIAGNPSFFAAGPAWLKTPRYHFSEPVRLGRVLWDGVVPRQIWDQIPPAQRDKLLAVDFRFFNAAGAPIGTMTLGVYPDAKGGGGAPYCMPLGKVPDLAEKVASFEFDVRLDASGLPPGVSLDDPPALESVSFSYRTTPVWTQTVQMPASADPGIE